MYTPKPIDTSDVILNSELNKLVEKLAENVHDVWAKQRIEQGWTYGATRDDGTKKHPCLVPYAQLSETEREYDRSTTMETIKLIKKLGFAIL